MIHVQQRPLRPFEQHAAPALESMIEMRTGIGRHRHQARRHLPQQLHMLSKRGALLHPGQCQQLVGPVDPRRQQRFSFRHVAQVADPDASAAVLVLVRRPDAPLGGADMLPPLFGQIEQLVIRQHQMGAIGDQHPAADIDPAFGQAVEFAEEALGIDHDAVTQHADRGRMQNPARNQPQDKLRVADHDGVAGIGPALIARDDIRSLRNDVDEFALTLVSPLGPDDDETPTIRTEHHRFPFAPVGAVTSPAPSAVAVSIEIMFALTSSARCCS